MTKEVNINTSKSDKVIKISQLQLAKDVAINLIRDCEASTKEKIVDAFNTCIKDLQK